MTPIQAKPPEGLSLSCSDIEQSSPRRPRKAGGYVSEKDHEALKAHCWYRQVSQSEFVTSLVLAKLEQLQRSGQLTPSIIQLYRTSRRTAT